MRSSIVVLILVLAVGSVVIFLGFLTNQEYVVIPELSNQYENLEKYKYELEKINQYNQQILKDLEKTDQKLYRHSSRTNKWRNYNN